MMRSIKSKYGNLITQKNFLSVVGLSPLRDMQFLLTAMMINFQVPLQEIWVILDQSSSRRKTLTSTETLKSKCSLGQMGIGKLN